MAPRPASCLLFPRFPGEEGESKAPARWVLQLFGKIPRFRGEIVPGAREHSGLWGPKAQPKKSALPKPACGGSENPHAQREHHPRVLEKCWKAGEDSIGLEPNNAAVTNKAGRYFQAQTHFPESMKKSSAVGRARGEEAVRVSWGRTGCSRQRCRHEKPVHHLWAVPSPGSSFSVPREGRTWLVPHGSSSPGCLWFGPPPTMQGPPAQLPLGRCIFPLVLCSSRHAAQQDKPGTGHPQLNFFTASSLGKIRLFIY